MINTNAVIYILIGIAVMLTLSHATSARDDLEAMQNEYCEMTQLHKETKGQFGWPDYRGNAKEVCK